MHGRKHVGQPQTLHLLLQAPEHTGILLSAGSGSCTLQNTEVPWVARHMLGGAGATPGAAQGAGASFQKRSKVSALSSAGRFSPASSPPRSSAQRGRKTRRCLITGFVSDLLTTYTSPLRQAYVRLVWGKRKERERLLVLKQGHCFSRSRSTR